MLNDETIDGVCTMHKASKRPKQNAAMNLN